MSESARQSKPPTKVDRKGEPKVEPKVEPKAEIEKLRTRIDSLDMRILELLEGRADLAKLIGQQKRKQWEEAGDGHAPAFYDPEREQKVLNRLNSRSRGAFPATALPFVFREIMSACRSLETVMRVAFLGPAGTFTQIAANQAFGKSIHYVEASSIEGVFDAVERGHAGYGVVPFENSSEGGIPPTLDAIVKTSLFIQSEISIQIHHCLVSKASKMGDIKRVYSHPQALGQCRKWISKNLPGVEVAASPSTAAAAQLAASTESSAAICSRQSAESSGLLILREGIQDQPDNTTRFVVLSATDGPRTGFDCTSVVFCPRHGSQGLSSLLQIFAKSKIPVSRLESRADGQKMWKLLYFVDFDGHREDGKVKRVLDRVSRGSEWFKVLGSYPRERK